MSEAVLKISFIVIGAAACGLSTAITLRKAGHEVTLLEVEDQIANTWGMSGCIVPPNMSKLLVRWGMGSQIQEGSVQSTTILMNHYEHEEFLGEQAWHEELLKDAGGACLYMHYADIRQVLWDMAVSLGTKIIPEAEISSLDLVDDGRCSVRLASGEVLEADVIIGTDGPGGIARKEVIGQEVKETTLGMSIFSITVPQDAMAEDPELKTLLDQPDASHTWLGYSRGAMGHIAGVRPEYALQVYVPEAGTEELWGSKDVPKERVSEAMAKCEPRLRKLVECSSSIRCVPLTEPPELETWVHDSGRLIIIGDAAHPFPRGSTNGVSISICDAASLGELFRHLHSENQIESFLLAFDNFRRDRVKSVLGVDLANYSAVAMPPGEAHEQRDNYMREQRAAGTDANALEGNDADLVAAIWEDKMVFAYDAEDHAAEWWNDWGLLEERAASQVVIQETLSTIEIQCTVAPGSPGSDAS